MDKKLEENMPIYVQIMSRIREGIASGELKPGEKISSVRDLAQDFGVNPNTMQRALTELEREGLLNSERTSGRFVTEEKSRIMQLRDELAVKAAENFYREMAALGFKKEEMVGFFREKFQVVEDSNIERIG